MANLRPYQKLLDRMATLDGWFLTWDGAIRIKLQDKKGYYVCCCPLTANPENPRSPSEFIFEGKELGYKSAEKCYTIANAADNTNALPYALLRSALLKAARLDEIVKD